METIVAEHPLAQERLSRLRDEATSSIAFRRVLEELSLLLLYEATRDLPVEPIEVKTPLAVAKGVRVEWPPLIVPVLRAALGMLDAALTLLPTSEVGFLGMRRNETTHEPEPYLHTVPRALDGRPVLVLDPMLATGGSLEHACRVIDRSGPGAVTAVCVLAAPEGITRIERTGLVSRLVVAAVDDHLDTNAFIVPGLGDAGDRQFGEP